MINMFKNSVMAFALMFSSLGALGVQGSQLGQLFPGTQY